MYVIVAYYSDWHGNWSNCVAGYTDKVKADDMVTTLRNYAVEARHNRWNEWDTPIGVQRAEMCVWPDYDVDEVEIHE